MNRPYSERFLFHVTSGYSPYYTVAGGERVVLKSLIAFNGGAAAGQVVLELKGFNVWSVPVPAGQGGVSPAFTLPVYSGESFRVYVGGTGFFAALSGYRFQDL